MEDETIYEGNGKMSTDDSGKPLEVLAQISDIRELNGWHAVFSGQAQGVLMLAGVGACEILDGATITYHLDGTASVRVNVQPIKPEEGLELVSNG